VFVLKLWPQKIWKKIIFVFVLILIVAFVAFAVFAGLLMSGIINREVVSEIDVVNSDGDKNALIVYQPGFSSLPTDVSYAFAEGLASSGWRVEITTASPQAPSDFSKYSLLVLGYPNYGSAVGTAIVKYVDRVDDLGGVNTVIISCGRPSTASIDALKPQVEAKNGTSYEGFGFSNSEEARQAGSNITP
jgi:hypothetical protein